jgi:hypothetical protein
MPELEFEFRQQSRIQNRKVNINQVVIAGWTGRDNESVQHHIDELKAVGIPAPSATPMFYRVSAELLTQKPEMQVLGPASSGEVEPVLFAAEDGIWLTVGSDHTDRDIERAGIALAKQLCSKPIAQTAWRWDEVRASADTMLIKSWISEQGERVQYQQGSLDQILPLDTLLEQLHAQTGMGMEPGTLMFCGTVPAIGGIRPSNRFSGLILDPAAGRTITLEYATEQLRIVS